jgi:5,10-methylenetetrahydromethanopterin reductase
MTGVIGHVANPDPAAASALARTAEEAGARWIGLADAFWWRDVWMLLAGVAAATGRIEIGPAMTNPYLRHPFHTVSALATLQELAGGRVFCGIAAGGSELTAAAGVDRRDAPQRAGALVALLRAVAAGKALDPASGRALDVALAPVPVLMAGRGDAMLTAAGRLADRVLLWAIPQSDLERSVAVVRAAAAGRQPAPELIWAPLVRLPSVPESSLGHVAVYAAINTASAVRAGWRLDPARVGAIRRALVAGGTAGAVELVPAAALDDLVLHDTSAEHVAARASALGVESIAVPGFTVEGLADQLAWAAAVERELTQ